MNYQELTPDEGSLLLQLRAGDITAFDEIFNRYAGPLHTYISMRLNGSEEADDVLQEVFIRLWNKRTAIIIHSSFRNYLYTIVQHCISDHIRASKRRKYILREEMPDQQEITPLPDEQYQYKQVYYIWRGAMDTLPGQMRRIYAMKIEEQRSVKEIAAELRLSEQTVKNQLHTAGQRIVKLLRQVQLFFL
ncbi:sigma-70 family RNA polymerase sigma factor [Paraflavitalea sp. CAU 1676]|uniref:RNA polymerase sigma factor n=1 Tax=Paraflavitalea sp. CAU 1676 TaxID=3032598 RepID=UPI0023DAECC2|nr:sigma-70 family RNA polymerase sigma factor [Paraflavitalea sp. CAU 1676]MDF2192299.1 sigma-70 family RNA polymerase sigma factor [Paraflavitalea sp. CAU 1676]